MPNLPPDLTNHDPEAVPAQVEHFDKEFDPYESYTTPELYGDLTCSICKGRGRLNAENPPGYKGPPSLRLCRCVIIKDVRANMERARTGLSKARRVPKSPLVSRTTQNLRIAADEAWFDAHLRHVALRQSPRWDFRIVTDADLVQAWLATAASKGMEIFDADVRRDIETRSLRYMTLTDVATSASLLIIRLGIKAAPNKEMPNVLLETILIRKNEGLPTWLWEPSSPHFRLAQGHICWSEFVEAEVGSWEQVGGTDDDLEREVAAKSYGHKKLVQERVRVAPPPSPVGSAEEEEEEEEEEEAHTASRSRSDYDYGAAMGRIGEPTDKPKHRKPNNHHRKNRR